MSNQNKFYCEKCVYGTNKRQYYDTHVLSKKHISTETYSHLCHCKKGYKTHHGLWKHKKVCSVVDKNETNNNNNLLQTVLENQAKVLETQTRLENIIIDLNNKPMSNINSNNNNTTNNITILYPWRIKVNIQMLRIWIFLNQKNRLCDFFDKMARSAILFFINGYCPIK